MISFVHNLFNGFPGPGEEWLPLLKILDVFTFDASSIIEK